MDELGPIAVDLQDGAIWHERTSSNGTQPDEVHVAIRFDGDYKADCTRLTVGAIDSETGFPDVWEDEEFYSASSLRKLVEILKTNCWLD